MKTGKLWLTVQVAALIGGIGLAGAVWADDVDEPGERLDNRGDRIEERLDNRGDRIDRRLDNKGDRVDRRLDNKGDRADRRRDKRSRGK